jgi:3-hydroxybutyryl-CoA dehydrogenase
LPIGPIALLDYVGLDVSRAIGESLRVPVPRLLVEPVEAGLIGRKSGATFYRYT